MSIYTYLLSLVLMIIASLGNAMQNPAASANNPLTQSASASIKSNAQSAAKYICEVCNKSFTRAHSLKLHMRQHTGEKPFACTWDKCTRKFDRSRGLKIHMATHTGKREFRCPYPECDKDFAQDGALKHHITIHTGKREFRCPQSECDAIYTRKSVLDSHIAKVHNQSLSQNKNNAPEVDKDEEDESSSSQNAQSATASQTATSAALLQQSSEIHPTKPAALFFNLPLPAVSESQCLHLPPVIAAAASTSQAPHNKRKNETTLSARPMKRNKADAQSSTAQSITTNALSSQEEDEELKPLSREELQKLLDDDEIQKIIDKAEKTEFKLS